MRELRTDEIELLQEMISNKAKKTRGLSKLRVCIYARKSAEDDKQISLDTQINECRAFIKKYDKLLEESAVFKEDNVSGMFTTKRKEFQQMITGIENGIYDIVLVMKYDRFARALDDMSTYFKRIISNGAYIIAGDDQTDNSPSGEMVRAILWTVSQYHARRTASDVEISLINKAKSGLSAGGIAPYGYKLIDQRYVIDENEAPAIEMMFSLISEGNSYRQVLKRLRDLGYRTRNNTDFSYSSLNTMLRNEKYYGLYIYNRKDGKKKKERVLQERLSEVRTTDAIPKGIIDKKLFDKVQAILSQRNEVANPRSNATYILTGILYCSNGHPMSGNTCHGGRKRIPYRTYRCAQHSGKSGTKCPTKDVNADYLEHVVKNIIIRYINRRIIVSDISANIGKSLLSQATKSLNVNERRIADLDISINQTLKHTENPNISSALLETYQKRAEEYLSTQQKYRELNEKYNRQIESLKAMIQNDDFSKIKLSEKDIFQDIETSRTIIKTIIKHIIVDDTKDEISIEFND